MDKSRSAVEPVPRDAFADLLPVEARYIAPGEFKIVDKSGHDLFYVEGSSLAEWVRDRLNESTAIMALIEKVEKRNDFIVEIQTHYANGCRNDAEFMRGWLSRVGAALSDKSKEKVSKPSG